MTRALTLIATAILVIFAIGFMVRTLPAAEACMTLKEARAKYPTAHLWRTKGCWGLLSQRPRRSKPAPDILPRVAEVKAEVKVVADANGGDTFDVFNSFRERFITFALADESKKADRLILPREAFDQPVISKPEPVQLPPVKPQPPAKPKLMAWVYLLAVAVFLSVAIALFITRMSSLLPLVSRFLNRGRRIFNVKRTTIAARSDHKPATGGQRAPAASDGAGDQQPHLPRRDFYDWSGGTYERGHADHPRPLAGRRDDTGALGAWARSRGLRPAEKELRPPESLAADRYDNQPERAGWFGKRIALRAWL